MPFFTIPRQMVLHDSYRLHNALKQALALKEMGVSYSAFQTQLNEEQCDWELRKVFLNSRREILANRLDQRSESMVLEGNVFREVAQLITDLEESGIKEEELMKHSLGKAVGVKESIGLVRGFTDLEFKTQLGKYLRELKVQNRQLMKRQKKWLKRETDEWTIIDATGEDEQTVEEEIVRSYWGDGKENLEEY